jgi:hypothetical protein
VERSGTSPYLIRNPNCRDYGCHLRSRSRAFFEHRNRNRQWTQRHVKIKSGALNARISSNGAAMNRQDAGKLSKILRGFVSTVKIENEHYPFSYTSNVCPKTGQVLYLYYATVENGREVAIEKSENNWQFLKGHVCAK